MRGTGVKFLIKAILKGDLDYYLHTASMAYAVEYEDGEKKIVYNSLAAQARCHGVKFKIAASAYWHDSLRNPKWVIYSQKGKAVATIRTKTDGSIPQPDIHYYP